ncbi:MAG: hypothetical protein ACHQF2_03645 [Flavobacteriales bacterium]
MEKTLHSLVRSLRKEEIRHFRLLQERYDLAGDRKDILLFDHLLKHDDNDDEKILAKLYGTDSRNSFYRLCNRLKEQIEKSLLFQHYGNAPGQSAIAYYQLYMHFAEINNRQLALKYLHKAEQKAEQHHAYELLEMIYTAFIRLSNEESLDPSDFISKRQQAREKHLQIQQLDDVLSLLRYRIRVSQNFSGKQGEITVLMENTLNEVMGKKTSVEDPFIYFKIYESVSRILLSTQDFTRLESYLKNSLAQSNRMNWFTRDNHEIKLQMITYLVNASFKNRKYDQALEYCTLLKNSMDEFNAVYREKFLFYYYNGLVNTYSVLNKHKAVEIIEEALGRKEIVSVSMNALFLHLQLALQQFDLGEYKPAAKQLQRVYISDSFEKLDSGFRLKIKVFDMLLRNSLKDVENLSRLLTQSEKDFSEELKNETFTDERVILKILKGLQSGRKRVRQEAVDDARLLFQKLNDGQDRENQLVDYRAWLKETFRLT